ncbi:hypothetical protein BHC49_03040 [Snodgrassella alvi]|uniref:Uncharacterized protein n=1 Tax=Snodgrassella alvi TaxID=1196083 RepID=A0A2N9XZZ0_9NEIS|nr:hypothetical protein BHC49_03040 [Snodgrassella alvi]
MPINMTLANLSIAIRMGNNSKKHINKAYKICLLYFAITIKTEHIVGIKTNKKSFKKIELFVSLLISPLSHTRQKIIAEPVIRIVAILVV